MRLPADAVAGIGVDISLGNAEVENLDQLVARDAVIASQPEGEIAAVRAEVRDMLEDALLRGVGVGVLAAVGVVLAWKAIGPERRRQLWRRRGVRPAPRCVLAAFVVVVVGASAVLIALPEQDEGRPDRSWVPLVQAFPDVPKDPVLDQLEIVNGSATRGQQGRRPGRAGDVSRLGGVLRRARAACRHHRRPPSARRARPRRWSSPTGTTTSAWTRSLARSPGGRTPGAAHRPRRRHVQRRQLGGVQHQLARSRVPRLPDRRGRGQPRPGQQCHRDDEGPGLQGAHGTPVTFAGIRFLGCSDPRSSGFTAGYDGDESDNIAAIVRAGRAAHRGRL